MERFFEPVPFGPQMGSCLPLLCRVGGYPQELHFPDSFALGLLISSVKGRLWQEIAGWGLWRGPDISVLLSLLWAVCLAVVHSQGPSSHLGIHTLWAPLSLSPGRAVASCIAVGDT